MAELFELAIENVNVAKFHLRVEDRIDVLNADVAAGLRPSTVELHAAGDVRVDGQGEEAQCVVCECTASTDFQ